MDAACSMQLKKLGWKLEMLSEVKELGFQINVSILFGFLNFPIRYALIKLAF